MKKSLVTFVWQIPLLFVAMIFLVPLCMIAASIDSDDDSDWGEEESQRYCGKPFSQP